MIVYARTFAIVFGIFLPLGETVRRWGTGNLPSILDDYLIGVLFLYGAWRSRTHSPRGLAVLAAALAFGCGIGYCSFFGHLRNIDAPDPAPIPHAALTALLGAILVLGILAVLATLKALPDQ